MDLPSDTKRAGELLQSLALRTVTDDTSLPTPNLEEREGTQQYVDALAAAEQVKAPTMSRIVTGLDCRA